MAVITYTQANSPAFTTDVKVITWTPLANGDSGQPLESARFADRSVQVTGTFGASGNLRLEGSNDGTNYVVLTDPQGNALNLTAAGIEAVMEVVRYIRPRVTNGDGTTSLTVTLCARMVAR